MAVCYGDFRKSFRYPPVAPYTAPVDQPNLVKIVMILNHG
jgi:hypothetical protein